MQNELIDTLTETFEGHAQETENGVEYWLARDLQQLLVYTKWDNFLNVISKAKTACEVSGHNIVDHFADVGKMVEPGSCSQWEISKLHQFSRQAARRLTILDNAETLSDLAALPSNRLEELGGDRVGQYSIRINLQWRVCFRWTVDGPGEVEIVDYH